MSEADRIKWDDRYRRGDHAGATPSVLIDRLSAWIPQQGQAIDVAGGAGRHAIWLAQRGLQVTLADISKEGLALAAERARERAVSLTLCEVDLESGEFPPGPWDLIFSCDFICRPLFEVFPDCLSESGRLIVMHPTRRNLERHDRPPERFLLEPGELMGLCQGLNLALYEEAWQEDGRHVAIAVAESG